MYWKKLRMLPIHAVAVTSNEILRDFIRCHKVIMNIGSFSYRRVRYYVITENDGRFQIGRASRVSFVG